MSESKFTKKALELLERDYRNHVPQVSNLAAYALRLLSENEALREVVNAAGSVRERLTGHPNTNNCPCGACGAGRAYDAARAKAEEKGKP